MTRIQEIKTESSNNEDYFLTQNNNLESFKTDNLIPGIDLWNLYLKEEITFAELLILQLLREYYNYS